MALIVAFPYTGVAFAHTETMKMDEPGSVHPPGVCFTLFFYSLPPPPPPLYFSFFSLLFVFYLPFNNGKNPLQLAHTRAPPPGSPCPVPLAPGPDRPPQPVTAECPPTHPRDPPPGGLGPPPGRRRPLAGHFPVSAGSSQSETHASDL